jgi:uncharacterized membrane protein
MKNFLIQCASLAACVVTTHALAAQIKLCNYTGETVWAVRAEYAGGSEWRTIGYYEVLNNECKLNVAKTTNTRYYYYAYGLSGKEYTGPNQFCIVRNRAFALETAQNISNCAQADIKSFFCRWTADSEVDEVIFTPGGAGLHEARCDI